MAAFSKSLTLKARRPLSNSSAAVLRRSASKGGAAAAVAPQLSMAAPSSHPARARIRIPVLSLARRPVGRQVTPGLLPLVLELLARFFGRWLERPEPHPADSRNFGVAHSYLHWRGARGLRRRR